MARRRVIAYATEETLTELRALVVERGGLCRHCPITTVNWY